MKAPIDYGWVIGIVVVVALVVFWKPIFGTFSGVKNQMTNKEGVDRGRAIFYDAERWQGEGSYRSCAMCHDPNFKPDPTKKIDMVDYKQNGIVSLKGTSKKYGNILSGDDEIVEHIETCLSLQSRIAGGRVSTSAPFFKDLLAYVKSL